MVHCGIDRAALIFYALKKGMKYIICIHIHISYIHNMQGGWNVNVIK